jgi:putative membrane protein
MKGWIYPHGGGYFGVPLSNFAGWIIAAFCYTAAAGLFLRRRPVRPQPLSWSLQPPVLLLVLATQPALGLLLPDAIVQDPSGRAWHTRDLYETETIAAMLTLMFAAVMATIMALRHPSREG